MTLNSEGLEKAWRFAIQHGPDGEANYAWVYNGKDLVATMRTHHAYSIVEAMNRHALPTVDGLEVVMEKICHKEQIGIWANEITSALALSDFLREEWTFDDSVDLEREIAAQLRDIIKSAITHPGLNLVASLSQASSVIAGLKEEKTYWWEKANEENGLRVHLESENKRLTEANEALMRERTSLIETKREQIERLTKERDEARTYASASSTAKLERANNSLLSRISSLEEENKRLREALGSAYEHIEQLSELLKIIKNHWIDYDHVFSIAVHEADEFLAARQALEDHNG
jgi:hypothetical protein